jgi:hypothetical protein
MGPQVHLRMPVLKKEKSVRIEFMAFGGGWVDQTLKTAMEHNPHTGDEGARLQGGKDGQGSGGGGLGLWGGKR